MANGFGNVYVFNLYVENMTAFNLNGQGPAGTIAGPVETSTPPYEPQQLVVSRTNLTQSQLSSPLFVQGSNDITVDYLGQAWKGTVVIGTQPALQYDLWLYIGYQVAFLFDTVGNMIPQSGPGGTLTLVPTAASDKGNDAPLGGGGGKE
jgi:hypothetical protein